MTLVSWSIDPFRTTSILYEEAGVAIVPGEAFEMPGFVRFACCKSQDYLRGAMENLKKAMDKL